MIEHISSPTPDASHEPRTMRMIIDDTLPLHSLDRASNLNTRQASLAALFLGYALREHVSFGVIVGERTLRSPAIDPATRATFLARLIEHAGATSDATHMYDREGLHIVTLKASMRAGVVDQQRQLLTEDHTYTRWVTTYGDNGPAVTDDPDAYARASQTYYDLLKNALPSHEAVEFLQAIRSDIPSV